ncbi:MAG: peptidylprolyl isomerase [Vampirovibrio sp.]|nr:peptidylprolyl isomerase [Vampirovibrio sp.]
MKRPINLLLSVFLMMFVISSNTAVMAKDYSWWNPMRYFKSQPAKTPTTEKKANTPKTEKPNPNTSNIKEHTTDHLGARIDTQKGTIYIELYPEAAPKTVKNFVKLVNSGFYNAPNMKFHRVVEGFVVQTGDPTGTGYGGSDNKIPLEVDNKLSHKHKGMVAMARGPSPNSATSQFYITLDSHPHLDGKYAVFGKVIKGLDIVGKIEKNDRVYNIQTIDTSKVTPDPETQKQSFAAPLKKMFGAKATP